MLTIEELRAQLGQPDMPDKQAADIRDTLYAFADTFIAMYLEEQRAMRRPPADEGQKT